MNNCVERKRKATMDALRKCIPNHENVLCNAGFSFRFRKNANYQTHDRLRSIYLSGSPPGDARPRIMQMDADQR
jgi:hypothetical protein